VELDAELGRVAGVVTLGAEPGFQGRVEDLDLARMPSDAAWPGLSLSGRARVDLDLRATGAGALGGAILHAEQGSIQTADLPLPIPFEELDGELLFGNGNLLEVSSLTLSGPMFSAQLSGTVGQAASSASAPLDLQLDYQVQRAMRSVFQQAGLELDRDGKGQIRIRGTPSSPELR
jgi:type II secretion system protein N